MKSKQLLNMENVAGSKQENATPCHQGAEQNKQ